MNSTIGSNVKCFREGKGLSQAELAKLAKVGQSAISQIEAGKRNPRISTTESIANALECSVDDLLTENPA